MIITLLKIYAVVGLLVFLYLSNKYRNFLRLDTVFVFLVKAILTWPVLLLKDMAIDRELEENKQNKIIRFNNKKDQEKDRK